MYYFFSLFGTSIPTACFPGIGASILIVSAAKFNAMSSAKLAILLTLTPSAGFNSYLVIAGPTDTFSTFADTPKLYNVFCNLVAVSVNALAPPFKVFYLVYLEVLLVDIHNVHLLLFEHVLIVILLFLFFFLFFYIFKKDLHL